MYIIAVFDNFYNSTVYHMYLHALQTAKANKYGVITNKKYVDAMLEYKDSYFNVFQMERVSLEDLKSIPILGIEDTIIQKEYRTKTLMSFYTERNLELEKKVENFLDKLDKFSPIEGIFFMGESYLSFRKIAEKRKIKLIPYEFSTVRLIDGFKMNLMMANTCGQLYENNECKKRYELFEKEIKGKENALLSRKEIIALLERDYAIPCIPLLDVTGDEEITIVGTGGRILPFFFNYEDYTDDDLMTDCRDEFEASQIKFRDHPAFMDTNSVTFANTPRSPLTTILSSKRIAAVCSNTLFEAMLWNRAAYTRCNIMPFSFMCNRDVSSLNKVDEKFLNFYLFCFLVPGIERLFSANYWQWRENCYSELEVYNTHRKMIFEDLGIDSKYLDVTSEKRCKFLLSYRNACVEENFCETAVNYENLISGLEVNGKNTVYTLNRYDSETNITTSVFEISIGNIEDLNFIPLIKRAGIIRIHGIVVDNNAISVDSDYIYNYVGYKYSIPITNAKRITIKWEMHGLTLDTINELVYKLKEQKCDYQVEIEDVKNRSLFKHLYYKYKK